MKVESGIEDVIREIANGSNNGGRPRFNAPQVAAKLDAKFPAAKGGGRLYAYDYGTGRYRPDGVDVYRREVQRELGDAWKSTRSNEVLTFLEHSARDLWGQPPVDRIRVANGILNVADGTLDEHDPEFLSPIRIPVVYEPGADCPTFERFLAETLDPELRQVVFEMFGYATTPDNRFQKAFQLVGGGAAGKSTLLEVLTALLGVDNVAAVPLHRLEDRFGPADLYGRLANVYGDLDAKALTGSATFKAVVGGDRIAAERKYADAFEFKPYCRLFFSANEAPPTADASEAWFRRWIVIPFDRTLAESERDRELGAKLTTPAELSGILARSIEVLPDLLARGSFTKTDATDRAAEAFRTDSDSVAGFVGERVTIDPDGKSRQSATFPAYVAWCGESNRRPLGKQKFTRRLLELVPTVYEGKIAGVRYWNGITLEGEGDR